MKRRDSIKTILLSAIGTSITLESCITPEGENIANKVWEYQYGRTAYEKSRDEKFLNSIFFNDNELSTIEKIANIIILRSINFFFKSFNVVKILLKKITPKKTKSPNIDAP